MARIKDSLRLSATEIDMLMRHETRIRIATIGPGSEINLTPMTFGWANGLVYIFGRGQKVVNLRRNATATILLDIGSSWRDLQGIMMRGQAKVLENEAEEAADEWLQEAQMNLGEKSGLSKNGVPQPYAASASGRTRRWIVFKPTSVVSWDNSKLD
ncbi:MAG: pyridoxamine 5'-phosphate oxidase family protein [Proteobacteria bacterium]|nr:pyridoxamine 5'-phosphate oxidase family protein [Pseudomonadota bacterium]